MTYLEALRKIMRPTDVMDVIKHTCPKDTEVDGARECKDLECIVCWEREMPKPPKEEDHD